MNAEITQISRLAPNVGEGIKECDPRQEDLDNQIISYIWIRSQNRQNTSNLDPTLKHGIITVTTPTFLPGSLVAIHSFLRHNAWFKGDVIVLANQMEPRFQRFFHLFPNIRIEQISQEVIDRTEKVSERFPQFQRRKAQFYSLDLARFTEYDKLLFFDSDVLFRGDVSEVFAQKDRMLACGDGFYYKDKWRDPVSYNVIPKTADISGREVWTDNFNAGFMVFDGSLLREKHHPQLVHQIDHDLFGSVDTNHSDQLILNRHFKKDYRIISGKYNFRLGIEDRLAEKDGISYQEARMIHFTSRRKPWENVHVMLTIPKFENYRMAYEEWLENWHDFLNNLDNLPTVESLGYG
ncbi:MAG: hypothetical protein GYB31_02160 [Bacteroidetes bacterium]|nr:hypothetical protein [Bacteroidota bacterium]